MDAGMAALSVVLVILSYLCGSIPFGVAVARLTGGPDLRSQGQRAHRRHQRAANAGPTGVRWWWSPAMSSRARSRCSLPGRSRGPLPVEVLVAGSRWLGASRSIFLGFHGGRGVGTGVGTMLVIQPWAVLLATPVFIVVILLTRYVSLGSLLGSAAMVLFVVAWFLFANGDVPLAYPLYATVGCALVWLAHATTRPAPSTARSASSTWGSSAGTIRPARAAERPLATRATRVHRMRAMTKEARPAGATRRRATGPVISVASDARPIEGRVHSKARSVVGRSGCTAPCQRPSRASLPGSTRAGSGRSWLAHGRFGGWRLESRRPAA